MKRRREEEKDVSVSAGCKQDPRSANESVRRERRPGRSRYLAAIGNNKLPSNHRSTTVAVPATAVDRPLAGIGTQPRLQYKHSHDVDPGDSIGRAMRQSSKTSHGLTINTTR
ncbi:hypothetical protein WN51_06357 [Melipona quadrifasciata]|uniref:Uncharacterized protein n=1 Tax=Melipona quadrifasciata TaxID=166423 RepID=A0A0M8ZRB4_9HYME|nr:hypothetical protein WN51_06357 [Melipona quadrifasciata]